MDRKFCVTDKYNSFNSVEEVVHSILSRNNAKVTFEKKDDSTFMYLECSYWVNKKVLLQEYSLKWRENEMIKDQARKIAGKFGCVIRQLDWHSYV